MRELRKFLYRVEGVKRFDDLIELMVYDGMSFSTGFELETIKTMCRRTLGQVGENDELNNTIYLVKPQDRHNERITTDKWKSYGMMITTVSEWSNSTPA